VHEPGPSDVMLAGPLIAIATHRPNAPLNLILAYLLQLQDSY